MPERAVLTYADLATLPDDGRRRELIEGELIVSPSPRTRHQLVLLRLTVAFAKHLEAAGGGHLFFAPLDVVLSPTDVVEPDLIFVGDDRAEIVTDLNIEGVPSLLAEVVSESRYDRVRKRDLYARFGVPEYWVVDPDADRVEVHRLEAGRYGKPEILEPGDTLVYPGLPGLAIDLATLFRR